MKITQEYILGRMDYLIREKQKRMQQEKQSADKLYTIKMKFPKWFRFLVFNSFNPLYAVYVQSKAANKKNEKWQDLQPLQPFAVNFVQYCHNTNFEFDSSLYYPAEDDEEIHLFIDNRLKSLIPGYTQISITDNQRDMYKKRNALKEATKKCNGGFILSQNGKDYFLTENKFEEHTYIHKYGLKYLPDNIIKYISEKDFLDIGAYLGDTAIFLQKNYNPKRIFAYEPVSMNAEQLEYTVKRNGAENIKVIKKGLGASNTHIDIYIDPAQLSSSSTNAAISGANVIKESIQITTIDDECQDKTIGLIKMDIEGAEYSAIQGALQTIKRDKPVLLISLYHTAKDFFEIPPMLKEAVPEYQFRFMNIEIVNPFSEKILVAYPKL